MIYFHTTLPLAHGAAELISVLGAKRLVKFDGMCFRNKGKPVTFHEDDVIVCWGTHIPPLNGVRVINSNVFYPNQQFLNQMPRRWSAQLANCSFYAPSVNKNYNQYLKQFFEDGKRVISRMPIKELPGLVSAPFIQNGKFWKLYVVGGKPVKRVQCVNAGALNTDLPYRYKEGKITDQDVIFAADVCKATGIEVGSISMLETGKQPMCWKVLTAPWLDNIDDVKLFADHLNQYIKKGNDVDAGAGTESSKSTATEL